VKFDEEKGPRLMKKSRVADETEPPEYCWLRMKESISELFEGLTSLTSDTAS
jgi:hypothetical protein